MMAADPHAAGAGEPEWLHAHVHEPNPAPPTPDPVVTLRRPDGVEHRLTPADLTALPQQTVAECYIVSTGHGTSGPFTFSGVRLADAVAVCWPAAWQMADVISADGFGNRVLAHEAAAPVRPILLALTLDGAPLTREQGLVRLIVPTETDDALRQVKWVAAIEVH
jgi:DMSO/TMAO reductase YedYZ molybdopterin-dependent catalytic subunit